jgi:hypothetical protein
MSAVLALPMTTVDLEPDAEVEEQRMLISQLARARAKCAALAQDLRLVEQEIEALVPVRQQHQLALDACAALEQLAGKGGAALFWEEASSVQEGAEHLLRVRSRVEVFNARVQQIEDRRSARVQSLQQQSDIIDALEHGLFEAQEEEERRSEEWEIEREISEPARKLVMPWARDGEDDRRFRKSVATALLASVLFTALVAVIDLPARIGADTAKVPERVVRLLTQERQTPPPPREEAKPKKPEQLAEQKPAEKPAPIRTAKAEVVPEEVTPVTPTEAPEQGILAFRQKIAAAQEDQVVGRLGAQARIDNADYNSTGRVERSMLTTSAPGSSGGINLAALSRGGVGGGGKGMDGVKVTQATSAIKASGVPGGDRPLSGDSAAAGRTDEEIQIVFDRYKAALYRLYNKELRKDPTLRGQIILRLTIEPDGSVSLCELKASDMNAPELATQVIERVRTFEFGAKAVPAITINYPIDFLPAG